jgi:SAM-dependent methyltransferase
MPTVSGAFEGAADWYDLFNKEKDYGAEVAYLLEKIRRWQREPRTWLDIGCGTGRHLASLASRGIAVDGVDRSPAMIQRARAAHPEISFHVGTAQGFSLPRPYDAVSMLFHVLNYQTSDAMVREALRNVAGHLATNGVFVFDFWHTDAVLAEPPVSRAREARVGERTLVRISHPSEDRVRDRIEVRFEFRWDSPSGPVAHEETHSLRHFSRAGISRFLDEAGMRVLLCEGWMRDRPLAATDWYGLVCASPK